MPNGVVISSVVFPSRYASSFDGDNQEIALPMAARSSNSATAVELKHLSSGINLVVINNTGNTLWVDSVSITSATENLSGQALVTLSIDTLPIVSAGVDGSKSVTVYFDSAFAIANNGDIHNGMTEAAFTDMTVTLNEDGSLKTSVANPDATAGAYTVKYYTRDELPKGLKLDTDGSLSGTPAEGETFEGFSFVVRVLADDYVNFHYTVTIAK